MLVYYLIFSKTTYQPTLHFTPWSLDLFIHVPFQPPWSIQPSTQSSRRLEIIVHNVISVPPYTCLHPSEVKHVGWIALSKDTTSKQSPNFEKGKRYIYLTTCTKRGLNLQLRNKYWASIDTALLNPFSAGTVFIRQNLPSVDGRFSYKDDSPR